jgi:hypothetical protein
MARMCSEHAWADASRDERLAYQDQCVCCDVSAAMCQLQCVSRNVPAAMCRANVPGHARTEALAAASPMQIFPAARVRQYCCVVGCVANRSHSVANSCSIAYRVSSAMLFICIFCIRRSLCVLIVFELSDKLSAMAVTDFPLTSNWNI